jgi:hypothetical protein
MNISEYSPDEATTKAFEKAAECLPETMSGEDFAALFMGVLRQYEMNGPACAEVAMMLITAISIEHDDIRIVRVGGNDSDNAAVH